MKSQHLIIPMFLLLCFVLKAEEQAYERVYIHTDKDCYMAGEEIQLKFYVINRNFQPSVLSQVGYVEICDTEKPQMQLKVALEQGRGAGTIKIPKGIPSGIYQLSAYTRYMRNEGEKVFFTKQIAIVNAGQQIPDPKRFELVEKYEDIQAEEKNHSSETELDKLVIKTDQNEYGNREKVVLTLDNIPDNTADLVISVRMRNEGEEGFYTQQIAIVNAGQQIPGTKRFEFELVEKEEDIQAEGKNHSNEMERNNLWIKTDQNNYGNREKVVLTLDNIPDNTTDLVISVSRNDSIAFVPETNRQGWLKLVEETLPLSRQWLPEYEGHIISGRFVPKLQEGQQLLSSIAFAGNDICYFNGQVNSQNGTADFYTAGIYGKQQVVTSVISPLYEKVPYRLDLLTPFSESLPGNLPVLQIYPNEKQIIERYIGVQIQDKMDNDLVRNPIQSADYSSFQPILSYDLDEYTRFSTISETILEFVNRVRVSKVGGARKIQVFLDEGLRFNVGNTLVLLDGIPIYDHEDILRYNPMYIKKLNVYDGRYLFGGEDFECIVSFSTHEGNMPFFQLSEGAQLFNYDCPLLPSPFEIPDYSIDAIRNSRKPDFRHTLYWNPFVELTNSWPVNLSFYTSDLCGEFKVTVEGITSDGQMIHGRAYFQVTAPPNKPAKYR